MKFSGHQTFPLRISWLPKAVEAFVAGEDPLTNPEKGIVDLGLGKNMVTALRFWVDAYNVATYANSKWTMTQFGDLVFNPDSGADPFLEDPATAWLLHWQISTRRNDPLFAWDSRISAYSRSKIFWLIDRRGLRRQAAILAHRVQRLATTE